MKKSKKDIIGVLKHGIHDIVFKKKSNGKIRHAKATLDKKIVPQKFQEKKTTRRSPTNSVIYYDVEKGNIRSFKDYLLQKIYDKRQESLKDTEENTSSKKSTKQK